MRLRCRLGIHVLSWSHETRPLAEGWAEELHIWQCRHCTYGGAVSDPYRTYPPTYTYDGGAAHDDPA